MKSPTTFPRGSPRVLWALAAFLAALLLGLALAACKSDSSTPPPAAPPPGTPSYTIYGSVTGLQGIALTLRINDTQDVTLTQDAPQTALLTVPDGTAYSVAEVGSNGLRNCALANASGTVAGADVTIAITCRVYAFFSAQDTDTSDYQVWRSDGTEAGTLKAATINPTAGAYPYGFKLFNGALYFAADGGDGKGYELWRYDGINPPERVSDIDPAGNSNPDYLTVFNGALYFQAADGFLAGQHGFELWRYDGTGPPTLVHDIYPDTGSGQPGFLTVFNGALYFQANGGPTDGTGTELWRYDGTGVPTRAFDISAGPNSSYPVYLTVFDGALYFAAASATGNGELYRYDGSTDPPVRVAGEPELSDASYLVEWNGKLYFSAADDTDEDRQLWSYDATDGAQAIIVDPTYGIDPYFLTAFGSALYFGANHGLTGYELWKYDGLTAPAMVKDIVPDTGSSSPFALDGGQRRFATVEGGLLFGAYDDGTYGPEPWISDGTAAGTHLVRDICLGTCSGVSD